MGQIGTSVTEGGADDSYDLVLGAKPIGEVILSVTGDDQVEVEPTVLTLDTVSWDVPQTVTVAAVDDATVEGPHVSVITHSTSGGGYDGVSMEEVEVPITDNDGGIATRETGGSTDVTETGTTDAYTLVLTAEPLGAVNVTTTADSQARTSPEALTFGIDNWQQEQIVTVTAVDDAVVEGRHKATVTHAASGGGGYDHVAIPAVVVNIGDNDTGTVIITESIGSTDVAEGSSADEYSVVLGAPPPETVVISVEPDIQIVVEPATLTFTPQSWDIPQKVIVTAIDDQIVEGSHRGVIVHIVAGQGYDGVLVPNVVVNISDSAGNVRLTESRGFTAVAEGDGAEATTECPYPTRRHTPEW